MFHAAVQHIEPFVQAYGALGVLCASILEEIVAPIPSTLVVFSSAVLLTQGLSGWTAISTILLKIVLPASVGITIGSLFPYFLARIGEKVAVERFGKYLGLKWESIAAMQKKVEKTSSAEIAIFISRAIPGVPSLAVSIFAGLARMPLDTYILWSFLGCIPRNFILGLLGWWGGRQYGAAMEILSNLESHVLVIIVAVVLALGIGWLLFEHKRKRRKKVHMENQANIRP
jgi:membrane protein DedA with SNARE-associated domain